jgi:hypothetical protein
VPRVPISRTDFLVFKEVVSTTKENAVLMGYFSKITHLIAI